MSKFIANSFQVPNAFVDEMLEQISGNACKIYLLIVRKTRGWNKESDRISYSQIQKFTGINSRATISKALDELLSTGLITAQKGNEKTTSEYRLNDGFASSENEPVKNCTSSKNEPTGSKIEPKPSSKNEHTEIHINKNTYTEIQSEYIHDENTQENFQTSPQAKTPKTNSSAKKFLTADDLVKLGVDIQVANDFIATRKTKLTQTAINGMVKQASLANITLGDAIEIAVENGWQSFKADWYHNQQQPNNTWQKPNKPNRMAEFAQQASQWGDDYYSQPSLGVSK